MPEPVPPPAPKALSRKDQRLLWILVIAAWLALGAWAVMTFRSQISTRMRGLPPERVGEYHRVQGFVAPLALRLEDGRLVKPAGVAVPSDQSAADRAALRLRELAPPGTDIYIELEPQFAAVSGAPLPASIWLPPSDTNRPQPFPFDKSRLVGALLIQEGLVAVDQDEPYMYKNELEMLEDDARRHGRGLWGITSAVASLAAVSPR
jgi:hypothetical protein